MESTLANTEMETLSAEMLQKVNAYWRAANYLSVLTREEIPVFM